MPSRVGLYQSHKKDEVLALFRNPNGFKKNRRRIGKIGFVLRPGYEFSVADVDPPEFGTQQTRDEIYKPSEFQSQVE